MNANPPARIPIDPAAITSLLQQGIDAFVQAGEIIVKALDGGWRSDEITELCQFPADVVLQLERIGRRQMDPRLLIADFPAANAVMRLPYSEQQRLMGEDTVEVVIMKDTGLETQNIHVRCLSRFHIRQVFATKHIRKPEEQRFWLEAGSARNPHVPKYKINGNILSILEPCELTSKDLARILAEMQ